MDQLSQTLINAYQKGFPVHPKPFAVIAEEIGVNEAEVLACFRRLKNLGVLSRLGPVFNHKKAGASTLAAVQVPEQDMDLYAEIINGFPCVNHNYAREHDFNLWFVVTAADQEKLQQNIDAISEACERPVLVLPMEMAYHIDLGFKVSWA